MGSGYYEGKKGKRTGRRPFLLRTEGKVTETTTTTEAKVLELLLEYRVLVKRCKEKILAGDWCCEEHLDLFLENFNGMMFSMVKLFIDTRVGTTHPEAFIEVMTEAVAALHFSLQVVGERKHEDDAKSLSEA